MIEDLTPEERKQIWEEEQLKRLPQKHHDLEKRVDDLETWKNRLMWGMAGVSLIVTGIVAIGAFLMDVVLKFKGG